jgi:hypothetical protein
LLEVECIDLATAGAIEGQPRANAGSIQRLKLAGPPA